MSPNALRRLSLALHPKRPYTPEPSGPTSTLALFLAGSKERFLNDVRQGRETSNAWTVVMGNEAGDLDSIACSIAYAYVESEIYARPTIAFIQTALPDLVLRPENAHALWLAGIRIEDAASSREILLTPTDIDVFALPGNAGNAGNASNAGNTSTNAPGSPQASSFPTHTFALVDHNRLGPSFTAHNPSARVVAVIDHHADEGLYVDTANPRIIQPAGSCASLVARRIHTELFPPELATLLLCAILVDTDGLTPGGKALNVDREAVASLVQRCTLASALTTLRSLDGADTDWVRHEKVIQELGMELERRKSDVTRLSGRDLLRRDYKEYVFCTPSERSASGSQASASNMIKAGLSTVPMRLTAWGGEGGLEKDALAWMGTRGLRVLGVLTSFRDGAGKHKREMAWFVLPGSARVVERGDGGALAEALFEGLERHEELELERYEKMEQRHGVLPSDAHVRVYKQGNAKASRKTTAPVLKDIIDAFLG